MTMCKIFNGIWRIPFVILIWTAGLFYGLILLITKNNIVNNNSILGRFTSNPISVYGLNVKISSEVDKLPRKAIYIMNHQTGFDIPILGYIIQPNSSIVAKTSLLWVPIFGWLMWIAGNIIINRKNAAKAALTAQYIIDSIHKNNHSVVIFPEGTRSQGRFEMGDFKIGAFSMAISAQIPIIPIIISDITKHTIGTSKTQVLVKIKQPIITTGMTKRDLKPLLLSSHELMLNEYRYLNQLLQQGNFEEFTDKRDFDQY